MTFMQAILILIIVIAVFILGRELMMWYWKVDRVIQLLESIDRKLGGTPPVT